VVSVARCRSFKKPKISGGKSARSWAMQRP
jgi:hypothetical protein